VGEDYHKYEIVRFRHWTIYVHQQQTYLGRCYIWSHRIRLIDLMDLTPIEREELFAIGFELRTALTQLFQPDLFNWASLGNVTTQCHVHLIPRYSEERQFDGLTFIDTRFGMNYAPYEPSVVPESTLQKLRILIRNTLAQLH
jgi:diadenosine tetraphosphate (Ap4A) HIT family hydrolase